MFFNTILWIYCFPGVIEHWIW